jgi:hypothetical protein
MTGISVHSSVCPAMARRVTSPWRHAATRVWAGCDLNCLHHGKPPCGELTGRG